MKKFFKHPLVITVIVILFLWAAWYFIINKNTRVFNSGGRLSVGDKKPCGTCGPSKIISDMVEAESKTIIVEKVPQKN